MIFIDGKSSASGDIFSEQNSGEASSGKKKMPLRKSIAEYGAALLSAKAYSEAELRSRMLKKGYEANEVETTVSSFLRHGFLNDRLLAENLCASLRSAGHGRLKIISKLRNKGISQELIEETLLKEKEQSRQPLFIRETSSSGLEDEPVDPELAAAEKALRTKMRTLDHEPDLRKRREKALRFLAGRGFSAGIAYQVIQKFFQVEDE